MVFKLKNESAEFGSSIGGEIKSLLGNFKSDINPNIERLQSHIVKFTKSWRGYWKRNF